MLVSLAMILLTGTLRAQPLDLKSYPKAQRDVIAKKLQEGEVCKASIADTRKALEDCSREYGDSNMMGHVLGGVIGGAVLTFLLCSVTHGCN